jgi:tRNA (guanine10-N2)-methyltransferase
MGSDLDIRVLKGYGVGGKSKCKIEGLDKIEKFDVFTNFHHYALPLPEIMIMDISTLQFQSMSEQRPILDAIVCDPPYGVRAKSQKAGMKDSKK